MSEQHKRQGRPGRPPTANRLPAEPARVVESPLRVPCLICPGRGCGQPIHPRIRRRDGSSAVCTCPDCGCRFVYSPSTVRLLGGS